MILTRLQLQHFRNYRRLDLQLGPGSTLLHGDNGAGKTNVVEAIFALATTKSFRARSDRELIDRNEDPDEAPYPFARIQGDLESEYRSIRVEMLIGHEGGQTGENGSTRKRFRLNGTPRRATDVVGQVKAVLFAPSDVDLITGSPSLRRRYLDLMLCQVDPSYLRMLQSYQRVVQQRNAVLVRLSHRFDPGELEFWDEKLVSDGTELIGRRVGLMERLSAFATDMYASISGRRETLRVAYCPSIGPVSDGDDVAETFRARLKSEERRSLHQGLTLVGPHRDDLAFLLDEGSLQSFGSRGQHRTAALALRMAEARYIRDRTGEQAVLLLDEALSELDEDRRAGLLEFVRSHPQVVLTGTTPASFPEDFRADAALLHVVSGEISRD